MSQNRIVWDGLAELKEALRALPAELTREAADIVFANADVAAQEIRDAYPKRTGDLAKHISVTKAGGALSTTATVKNTAKIAWLFENGSQARHYTTVNGKRHALGRMPVRPTFVPVMIRRRRIMYEVLKRVLTEHGLLVSGDA